MNASTTDCIIADFGNLEYGQPIWHYILHKSNCQEKSSLFLTFFQPGQDINTSIFTPLLSCQLNCKAQMYFKSRPLPGVINS